MITWLADVIRATGIPVAEVGGWKTRTATGDFFPISALHHHTASNKNGGVFAALHTVTFGRPDLSGPLCNVLVGRHSAGVSIVAAGRANHAGEGGPWRTIPKDSGNMYMVGFEWENDGIGEPWPSDQLEIGRKAEAAVLAHLNRDSTWLYGHKEWAPDRKIDPSPLNMDNERAMVKEILAGRGDFMASLSDQEQKNLLNGVERCWGALTGIADALDPKEAHPSSLAKDDDTTNKGWANRTMQRFINEVLKA